MGPALLAPAGAGQTSIAPIALGRLLAPASNATPALPVNIAAAAVEAIQEPALTAQTPLATTFRAALEPVQELPWHARAQLGSMLLAVEGPSQDFVRHAMATAAIP